MSRNFEEVYAVQTAAIERLTADNERLRGLLQTYGRHLDCCGDADSYNHADIPSCGCGFDAVLDEVATDQPQACPDCQGRGVFLNGDGLPSRCECATDKSAASDKG